MNAHPDDMELLNHEIRAALESGCFTRARDLCDHWNRLVPDHPNPLSEMARQLADAVDAGTFGEQRVREILQILAEIQRSEDFRTSSNAIRSYGRPPESFLYERTIHARPIVAAAMTGRLGRPDRRLLRADGGSRPQVQGCICGFRSRWR